ncbi:hypothetical protein U3516DRAFT_770654 [Neocallimastix sp. 'constans']
MFPLLYIQKRFQYIFDFSLYSMLFLPNPALIKTYIGDYLFYINFGILIVFYLKCLNSLINVDVGLEYEAFNSNSCPNGSGKSSLLNVAFGEIVL